MIDGDSTASEEGKLLGHVFNCGWKSGVMAGVIGTLCVLASLAVFIYAKS